MNFHGKEIALEKF